MVIITTMKAVTSWFLIAEDFYQVNSHGNTLSIIARDTITITYYSYSCACLVHMQSWYGLIYTDYCSAYSAGVLKLNILYTPYKFSIGIINSSAAIWVPYVYTSTFNKCYNGTHSFMSKHVAFCSLRKGRLGMVVTIESYAFGRLGMVVAIESFNSNPYLYCTTSKEFCHSPHCAHHEQGIPPTRYHQHPTTFIESLVSNNDGLWACTITSFASIINSRIKRWEDVILVCSSWLFF